MGGYGGQLERSSYWLFYVVSVAGALVHWRQDGVLLAAACAVSAVLGAFLIVRARPRLGG
ncbi:hypothetical protein [Nocardiopsis sp. CNT312]|uniref:hypothetical protein n=1 Tax=Nocardiopsis sp. CNT312 TaxID=1137268 RepID=UPI00048D40E3|nr:hypothetical protein [Nocardiopsis sp. CNT312]